MAIPHRQPHTPRTRQASCTSIRQAHPDTGSSVMPKREAASSTTAALATCPICGVTHSTLASVCADMNIHMCWNASSDMEDMELEMEDGGIAGSGLGLTVEYSEYS